MGRNRFLVPLLLPLAILADDGLSLLLARLRAMRERGSPWGRFAPGALVGLGIVALGFT